MRHFRSHSDVQKHHLFNEISNADKTKEDEHSHQEQITPPNYCPDLDISFNEINLNDDKMILKGDPIYLKDKDGMITTTSSLELKSSGELVLPEKINVSSFN